MTKSGTKLFRDYSKMKWIVLWSVNPARSGFLVSFDTVPQPELQHLIKCQALIKVTWLSSSMNAFLSSKAQSACSTVSLLCLFLGFFLFSQEWRKLSRTSLLWHQGPLKLVELSSQEISCWGRTEHSCLHQETCKKKLKSVFQCIQVRPSIYLYKQRLFHWNTNKNSNKPTQKIIRMSVHNPSSWWVKYPAQQVTI